MSKALLYSSRVRSTEDLHAELLEGVESIALAVASTLGPRGSNVIIDRAGETPDVTKDGVTVARNIQLTHPVHNAAVKMIQGVAKAHELEAGDGTTTATVLAHHLFKGGLRLVDDEGLGAVALQRAIGLAVAAVADQIRAAAVEATEEQLGQVATIATNGDTRFGELIAEAVRKVGREGTITLDDSDRPETWLEVRSGFQMDSGFAWPEFITDRQHGQAVLENPYILITERQLSQGISDRPQLHDLGPLLTFCAGLDYSGKERLREPRPLLIVADDVLAGSDAAQTLLLNHNLWAQKRGGLQVCVVRAPAFGEWRRTALADLAMATGGRVLTLDGGEILSKWVLDKSGRWSDANLGICTRAVISNGRCVIEGATGDAHDHDLLPRFAASLRQQAAEHENPRTREYLLQRAARLTGAVAVVHVGAPTDAAAKALRALAEDAVLAVRAALAEGVVPGGGLCLYIIAAGLKQFLSKSATGVTRAGGLLVAEAMRAPLRQIALNAGEDPDKVAAEVNRLNFEPFFVDTKDAAATKNRMIGFNAATGQYEDMVAAGIVDPAKVVRVALEKAASIAALMLTTSCLIYFDPEATRHQPIVQLPPIPMNAAPNPNA